MNDLYVQKGAADLPPPAEPTELPVLRSPRPLCWVGGRVPGPETSEYMLPCNDTAGGSVPWY